MFKDSMDADTWHFIAYTAGTGGSILIIGSAAGVVAMGMENIGFGWYLKRISLLALAGYIGGVLTFYFLEKANQAMPYLLVLASSSFIYIAVSDLIPQMHRRPHWQESLRQIVLIAMGVGIVVFLTDHHH